MDPGTSLVVSLVVSTVAGWLTSWALGLYVPDVTGGPRAVLVLMGATIVGVPADYAVEWAAEHQTGVGATLLGMGVCGLAFCGWSAAKARTTSKWNARHRSPRRFTRRASGMAARLKGLRVWS